MKFLDFGCGFGEVLSLWARQFGVSGIGIDIRENACARARQKMAEQGLADRIEIVCGNAAEYPFEQHAFDVAALSERTEGWIAGLHLLRTSILHRFCVALCDRVVGENIGAQMSRRFEQSNLFLVPPDRERQWYRYHHLFADFLRTRLMQTARQDELDRLHCRASAWCTEHDLVLDPVHLD